MTMMTEQKTTETILEVAEVLAEKLALTRRNQPSSFTDGETIIVVSEFGIEVGKVKKDCREKRIHRFTEYSLHGEVLVKETRRTNQFGLPDVITTSYRYPEGAIVYAGN